MHHSFDLVLTDNEMREFAQTVRAPGPDGTEARIGHTLRKKTARVGLKDFVMATGAHDATAMARSWLPSGGRFDVFISHSHADEDTAIGLALWLKKTFGLEVFVDSCVWGNTDDLLREIDDEHCLRNDGRYDYAARNRTTSHVHMLLSVALTEMIDASEVVFFLRTPSSSVTIDKVMDTSDTATLSPWIYHELMMTRMLGWRPRADHRLVPLAKGRPDLTEKRADFRARFTVPTDHLTRLDWDGLWTWSRRWPLFRAAQMEALDVLYLVKGIKDEPPGPRGHSAGALLRK